MSVIDSSLAALFLLVAHDPLHRSVQWGRIIASSRSGGVSGATPWTWMRCDRYRARAAPIHDSAWLAMRMDPTRTSCDAHHPVPRSGWFACWLSTVHTRAVAGLLYRDRGRIHDKRWARTRCRCLVSPAPREPGAPVHRRPAESGPCPGPAGPPSARCRRVPPARRRDGRRLDSPRRCRSG